MATCSKMTKKYRFWKNVLGFLSFLASFGVLAVFTVMGIIQGGGLATSTTICLTLTSVAAIILALIGVMNKVHLRSTMYVAMIGLWIALENIVPFIITLGICTILDELLFTPLYHRFKEDYHTNKQIDKRTP